MINPDSAFLWETEALRTAGRPRSGGDHSSADSLLAGGDWLTLKEASDITGVPTDTIRKWARRENIPSFLERTDDGHLRIVSLDGIRRWADEIGRDLEIDDTDEEDVEDIVVDLTGGEPEGGATGDPEVPEGSMLVPLDAWNKMLNQLGNLHEAGQQLAEARERAAKAETEARFLRDRLSEMRSELEHAREAAATTEQPEPETVTASPGEQTRAAMRTTLGGTAASLAKKLYEGWRERRRQG